MERAACQTRRVKRRVEGGHSPASSPPRRQKRATAKIVYLDAFPRSKERPDSERSDVSGRSFTDEAVRVEVPAKRLYTRRSTPAGKESASGTRATLTRGRHSKPLQAATAQSKNALPRKELKRQKKAAPKAQNRKFRNSKFREMASEFDLPERGPQIESLFSEVTKLETFKKKLRISKN